MNANETRILKDISSLSSQYAIISMPRTAWYWLDDLVQRRYPVGGYRALIGAFEPQNTDGQIALPVKLREAAQQHCDQRMAELYNLANDNDAPLAAKRPALEKILARPEAPGHSLKLPTILKLFHFMPHATYLTTVWERRNYHLRRTGA